MNANVGYLCACVQNGVAVIDNYFRNKKKPRSVSVWVKIPMVRHNMTWFWANEFVTSPIVDRSLEKCCAVCSAGRSPTSRLLTQQICARVVLQSMERSTDRRNGRPVAGIATLKAEVTHHGSLPSWAYEPVGQSPPPKKIGQFSFLDNDKNLGRRGFGC